MNTKKIIKIILLGIVISCLVTLLVVYLFLKNFSAKTHLPIPYFFQTVNQAVIDKQNNTTDSISFMVLGLDRRNDLLEKTETTDTIMLANINFKTAKLNLISIPRDLWSYSTNTKINDIYPLSKEKTEKFSYIENEFEKITGQKISATIIISTENLIDFVDLIGGVDIYLENGFVDEKYPNPDYIASPSASIPVYKTIEFKSGLNHLDKSNITEFVRSRKSAETAVNGGTDIGRIIRQQLLLEAIMQKVKNPTFLKNYSSLINLYNFWHQSVETNISDTNILTWGLLLGTNAKNITIHKSTIPTAEYPEISVIYHPQKFINRQWVYIPLGEKYEALHQFIQQSIND